MAGDRLGCSATDSGQVPALPRFKLIHCFTPVASPESNSMWEAFVETVKRDYVHVTPIPDTHTALDRIAGWFEDYNENHPHSGLRMRSPRKFRTASPLTARLSAQTGVTPLTNSRRPGLGEVLPR